MLLVLVWESLELSSGGKDWSVREGGDDRLSFQGSRWCVPYLGGDGPSPGSRLAGSLCPHHG